MAHGNEVQSGRRFGRRLRCVVAVAVSAALLGGGCFSGDDGEHFYGRVNVPRTNELRWSDGGLPQVFDPALAAVSPDTDVVRTIFEGLTDYDSRSLAPVPAVAARWESSLDKRVWTFHLRQDARWSNGDAVTAHDFVRSWQRTRLLGRLAPHGRLLRNIEGALPDRTIATPALLTNEQSSAEASHQNSEVGVKKLATPGAKQEAETKQRAETRPSLSVPFGAAAVSDRILRVSLERPDSNFPALVAHPVFRPLHQTSEAVNARPQSPAAQTKEAQSASDPNNGPRIVSNGAFQLTQVASGSVVLERAPNYWDRKTVALERVRFVDAASAEAALAAYQAGEVDVVTNAASEPLALKLLASYRDFQRATYGALTYYVFNMARPPFDNRQIREALAVAIDRDLLSADNLGGATVSASRFLPSGMGNHQSESTGSAGTIAYSAERARQLLAEAGYPNGRGFPVIRLLVNRNDQQRLVAEAVAKMWRDVLGVRTEVTVKSWDEYEVALRMSDYDIARRSLVMQTTDETTIMLQMFAVEEMIEEANEAMGGKDPKAETASAAQDDSLEREETELTGPQSPLLPRPLPVLTEAQALAELPGFPLYFASSFALVKPYVTGFNSNLLNVTSLKHVRIDPSWQPPPTSNTIRAENSD